MNFTPNYYTLVYQLDEVKKSFAQFRTTNFTQSTLYELIRLEINNGFNSISNAETLLRVRNNKNWKNCSITGLRVTEFNNYYYADLLINNQKSLIIVNVSEFKEIVKLFVCENFYPLNGTRNNVVKNLINQIKKESN